MRRKLTPEELLALRVQFKKDIQECRLTLRQAVRNMRTIAGMTQPEFARLLNIAPRTLIDLERGVGNPTLETMQKIGKCFNLQVGFIEGPRDYAGEQPARD